MDFQKTREEIFRFRDQFRDVYQSQFEGYTRDNERLFGEELNHIKNRLVQESALYPMLGPVAEHLYEYLWSKRWIGWGAIEFGPPLGLKPTREFPIAMLVYLTPRLMDDALDGHIENKLGDLTLYGGLTEKLNERTAASTCMLIASWLLTACLERLERLEFDETSTMLRRLFRSIVPGAVAELLCPAPLTQPVYDSIIQRKSVGYDMILWRSFLSRVEPMLRHNILKISGELSIMAQWINDCQDVEDDRKRGQPNILLIPEVSLDQICSRIQSTLTRLWVEARTLPNGVKRAFASRTANYIEQFLDCIQKEPCQENLGEV
ncbi:MAG: hypothetical protein JRE64_02525 [Deltaproteobacteria bacterium]|nr:hypothetical protein [Deltaproteobacteria bacterium]